jgi:hypothetical protein
VWVLYSTAERARVALDVRFETGRPSLLLSIFCLLDPLNQSADPHIQVTACFE